MWVFKGVLFLLLLFALVYFFVTNSGQSVDINFFGKAFLGISIYWVVVACFLLGFATSFVLAAFREFKFHRVIGRLKREAAVKDREIADLRTLPLQSMGADQQDNSTAGVD
ncbi:MAG: LapA family protein [Candidatus Krumholzibacteriota bacterium]